MANPEHLAKLKEGVDAWNWWRRENPKIKVDLSEVDLTNANLYEANLYRADLTKSNLSEASLNRASLKEANLSEANLNRAYLGEANLNEATLNRAYLSEAKLFIANLSEANLKGAILIRADLFIADLRRADLSEARLNGANLMRANLFGADLRSADLSGANLSQATLIETKFGKANLTDCNVYGVSVWDIRLEEAIQSNLVITPPGQSVIQVDNLEVAQFVYLLLNNERIRHVIDTITSKVVLILGRFTPERKAVLDAIRDELRKHDYLPILFDFEKPDSKDLTGTVTTLANMARFVIADLTDASSVPHELATIAPGTVVPIQPVLLVGQREYAMFSDLRRRHHWVLEPYQYETEETLLANLNERVIAPAEGKAIELRPK